MGKKIFLIIVLVLVAIQFIRPARNQSNANANDIAAHYTVPENVQGILKKACYDCHSNNTNYPWYTNIQPVGWWLQHHVDEGKEELNFSEFAAYTPKRQAHKLDETAEMIEHNEMPLSSYLIMHKEAKLTTEEKEQLISWAKGLQTQIASQITE